MKSFFLLLFITTLGFSQNILLLNSYHPGFTWTDQQSKSIREQLKRSGIDHKVYIEFLDTKRFRPNKINDKNSLNYYSTKYKNIIFDLIITTDDNALNFVRKHKKTAIFSKAKVFFCGVNNLSLKDTLDINTYAGVFEKKDPISNLELAKSAVKNLKTIYLIFDDTITANKIIKEYKYAFKNIKNINFVYLNNSDIDTVTNSLKNYDNNSVMFALVFSGFQKNKIFLSYKNVFNELIKTYKNPIIVHTSSFINLPNVIGGNCVSGSLQGLIASKKALEYINGTPMNKIGFINKSPNQFYFNMKNILKFNLNIDDLDKNPDKSIIINKPSSFYSLYKLEINIFLLLLIIVIVFLIIVMKKNVEIKQSARKINKLNANLTIEIKKALEENTKQLEILQYQNKMASMGEMIGAIAHQWRQPLTAISTSIQNLKYDFKDGHLLDETFIKEYIAKNKKTIKFMSKTIDDFRSFFRVDKEKVDFNIKETTQSVVDMQLAQLKYHNILLTIDGDEFIYSGFQSEYQQVILNIINNAKDALIENNIENPIIDIKLEKNIITIQDNAGGIPNDIINRIFEPYFTTKEQGKGTGMGLYMSKMIIDGNMGGELTVINNNIGAKFTIDFNKIDEQRDLNE